MKFSMAVQDLQYALKMVRDIKMVAGPLEGTAATLMRIAQGKATFTSYNGESLVKVTVNVSSDEEGECVFDAASVNGAVSMFQPANAAGVGTADIVFLLSDKTRKLSFTTATTYSNGTKIPHKRSFALMAKEGFPDFSSIDNLKTTFSTKAARLTSGIDAAAFALSVDRNNIIFTGMFLQISAGKMRLVSTNGICLAEYSAPFEYEGKEYNIVIPGSVASRISRSVFEEDDLEVCITDRHFFIRTENLLMGGPLIREDYPDYKSVIRAAESSVRVDKEVFLENLLNLSHEASTIPDNRVSVSLDKGSMVLTCGGSENEGLQCTGFDGAFSFDCNVKLLISTIKNLYGKDVEIGFSAPESPLHFGSTQELGNAASLSCVLVPLSQG